MTAGDPWSHAGPAFAGRAQFGIDRHIHASGDDHGEPGLRLCQLGLEHRVVRRGFHGLARGVGLVHHDDRLVQVGRRDFAQRGAQGVADVLRRRAHAGLARECRPEGDALAVGERRQAIGARAARRCEGDEVVRREHRQGGHAIHDGLQKEGLCGACRLTLRDQNWAR
jgi:hypothetical protein